MYGTGILKGMAVVMKHFIDSYLDDFYWAARGGRYYNDEALQVRQGYRRSPPGGAPIPAPASVPRAPEPGVVGPDAAPSAQGPRSKVVALPLRYKARYQGSLGPEGRIFGQALSDLAERRRPPA